MAIVRFDPFRDLASMQDRINRIFGEAYLRGNDDDVLNRGDWRPPVDIYENDKHEIVLRAELPGLKREDIDIRVENNTLTLRGERKRDAEVKQESYHRVERSYGAFSRSFSLPTTVNTEKVTRRLRRRRADHHPADARRSEAAADSGAGPLTDSGRHDRPNGRGACNAPRKQGTITVCTLAGRANCPAASRTVLLVLCGPEGTIHSLVTTQQP